MIKIEENEDGYSKSYEEDGKICKFSIDAHLRKIYSFPRLEAIWDSLCNDERIKTGSLPQKARILIRSSRHNPDDPYIDIIVEGEDCVRWCKHNDLKEESYKDFEGLVIDSMINSFFFERLDND